MRTEFEFGRTEEIGLFLDVVDFAVVLGIGEFFFESDLQIEIGVVQIGI